MIPGDSAQMMAAVLTGPLAVTIDASSDYFTTYTGGIISSPNCGTNSNFAANIIGWGTTPQANCIVCAYWVVRVSLGYAFGENGNVNIAMDPVPAAGRENNYPAGICGINQYVMTAEINVVV